MPDDRRIVLPTRSPSLRWVSGTITESAPAGPDAQLPSRAITSWADLMWYRQLVTPSADRAADIGSVYQSRFRLVIFGGASRKSGVGP